MTKKVKYRGFETTESLRHVCLLCWLRWKKEERVQLLESILVNMFMSKDERESHRKCIGFDKCGNIIISTVVAFDTGFPETAVSANEDSNWIVVETYDTEEAALIGHKKWTARNEWPSHLYDVQEQKMVKLSES